MQTKQDDWHKKNSPNKYHVKGHTPVDPDAPGTPGEPGFEPPVKRTDLDKKGKKLYDKLHSKKNVAHGKKDKKKEQSMKKKQKDWEPAFPGADHSKEQLKKMTKKQKEDYYN